MASFAFCDQVSSRAHVAMSLLMNAPHRAPAVTQADALQAHLRQSTAGAHRALDHHPLLAPLLRPGLDRAHYGRVLQAFHAIHGPLQARLLDGLLRWGGASDYRPSDRVTWLKQDLAFLGLDGQQAMAALATWRLAPVSSSAELIGELYVVEGSTLGGQVIARLLGDSLGITPETGGRFFHGHGECTGARWQAFWSMARRLVPESEYAACSQSAQRLFGALHTALTLMAQGQGNAHLVQAPGA